MLAMLVAANGCMVTGKVWERAGRDRVGFLDIKGIAPAPLGGTRALAVEYDNEDGKAIVLIPLNPDGSPQAPFAYLGHARTRDELWKSISDAQAEEIKSHVGSVRLDDVHLANNIVPFAGQGGLYDVDAGRNITAAAYRLDKSAPQQIPVLTATDEEVRVTGEGTILLLPRFPTVDPAEMKRRRFWQGNCIFIDPCTSRAQKRGSGLKPSIARGRSNRVLRIGRYMDERRCDCPGIRGLAFSSEPDKVSEPCQNPIRCQTR
jgi:hypothetical protein